MDDLPPASPTEHDAPSDRLAANEAARWAGFYVDRARPCPFFVEHPDECLMRWLDEGRVAPGVAIDLGCGAARNALALARRGFTVTGVDASPTALAWARERVSASGLAVALHEGSVLDLVPPPGGADFVYDSGCFHHIAPHLRQAYVRQVQRLLRPGGRFGLVCFRPEGGSGWSDAEIYARGSLGGGLGYTEAALRAIWSPAFRFDEIAPMREPADGAGVFGRTFLWAALLTRHEGE